MRTWSEDIDKALRAPFEGADIGLLPKVPKAVQDDQNKKAEKCKACDGWHKPIRDDQHVPYLSHTVVQARLDQTVGSDGWGYDINQVFEDGKGHVTGIMATLTIAGLTKGPEAGAPNRPGVAGEELKLAISDWLPRAAMRFGIQLTNPDEARRLAITDRKGLRNPLAMPPRDRSGDMKASEVVPALLKEHGFTAEEAATLILEVEPGAGDVTAEALLAARTPSQFAVIRRVLEAHSRKAA